MPAAIESEPITYAFYALCVVCVPMRQEAEGAGRLVEGRPVGLQRLNQMELVGSDLLRADELGGPSEVGRESRYQIDVLILGARGVVADAQVFEHPAPK
jgi:hypothetical protein